MSNQKSLSEIANAVRDLLTDSTRKRFTNMIQRFNTEWLVYWKARGNKPEPYHDPTGENGKDGFEYDMDFEIWFPIAEGQLPPDPINWEISDKYPCYYTLLAVVYDIEKGKDAPFRLSEGLDERCFGLIRTYLEKGSYGPLYGNDRLGDALSYVKVDLTQAQPNPESNGNKSRSSGKRKRATKQEKSNRDRTITLAAAEISSQTIKPIIQAVQALEEKFEDLTGQKNNKPSSSKERGRPPLSTKDRQQRIDLKSAWLRAKETKITKYDFCCDQYPKINPQYLDNILDWCRDHGL